MVNVSLLQDLRFTLRITFALWHWIPAFLKQTENTVAIHWFAGSWWSSEEKYAWKITRRLHRILPVKTAKRLGKAIAIARYRGWSSLAETFSDFCRKQRKHE